MDVFECYGDMAVESALNLRARL